MIAICSRNLESSQKIYIKEIKEEHEHVNSLVQSTDSLNEPIRPRAV